MAENRGLRVEYAPGTWRRGVVPADVEARLTRDAQHEVKAVVVVHNETSTGATSRLADIRAAIDRAAHPALLIVDAISSLASIEYRHDEWRVDVAVGCSQKGLMVPPGLGFNAMSQKAIDAAATARCPRSYWDWRPMLESNRQGFFPYTPSTNLLFGLREALRMLGEEGLPNVFARHRRHGEAARAAVRGWGLDLVCEEPCECSSALTAVMMPDGHDADRFRALVLERYDLSLGTGLGKLAGRAIRIGHLGAFNDLMLAGTLCGVEMGLGAAGVPHRSGGVMAALERLSS